MASHHSHSAVAIILKCNFVMILIYAEYEASNDHNCYDNDPASFHGCWGVYWHKIDTFLLCGAPFSFIILAYLNGAVRHGTQITGRLFVLATRAQEPDHGDSPRHVPHILPARAGCFCPTAATSLASAATPFPPGEAHHQEHGKKQHHQVRQILPNDPHL